MGLESQLCTLHHLDDKMRMFRAEGKLQSILRGTFTAALPCMRCAEWQTPRRLCSNKHNALRPLRADWRLARLTDCCAEPCYKESKVVVVSISHRGVDWFPRL
jgi:hypothetical protein